MQDLTKVDDRALVAGIRAQVGTERQVVADFLLMLGEIDTRRLYANEGFEALYLYVVALGFTEAEAFGRIALARLLSKLAWLYDYIVDGRLTLTALRHLAPHLEEGHARHLVDRAVGLSVKEVDRLIAGLAKPRRVMAPAPLALTEVPGGEDVMQLSAVRPDKTRYVTPERVEVKFSAREQVMSKFERVKALARCKGVGGTYEEILDHVLGDYLTRHDPALKRTRPRVPKEA